MKVDRSWLRFKNCNNVTQLENVLYFLSFFWESGCWPFQSDSYLICHWIFYFLFLAINSVSLWDPNFRLVLNFVLFLHQFGWSQRLLFISTHGPGMRLQLAECISQVCKQVSQGTWHLDWRSYVEDLTMVLFRGNSSSCWGASSNGVRKKDHSYIFLYLYIFICHCTGYFLLSFGLVQ